MGTRERRVNRVPLISKWDPFKDLLSIQDRMNRLFEETLSRSQGMGEGFTTGAWSPAVDIYEAPDEIVLKAELPGMSQDDIEIEVKDNILILKGERRFKKGVKEENYHRVERSYGVFQRTFNLPDIVQQDRIKTRFKNGILEIVLPKEEKVKPRLIKIDVD